MRDVSGSGPFDAVLPITNDAKVQMLLADRAQVVHGKLNVVGGGWSVMGPAPTPAALALTIEVPWAKDETAHAWRIALLDEDGQVVHCAEHGIHPIERNGSFLLEHLPDQAPGSPTSTVLAVQFGVLDLQAGRGYVWRLELNDVTMPTWQLSFRCRA